MIRKVKFSNFYSFDKEQEIDFLANKKKTYDYYQSKTGDQITKVAGFIGGNASGKTNVMRLFSFFRYFACESSKDESAGALDVAYKTFFNNEKPSNFYIEFEIEDAIFFYAFGIENNSIRKESLQTKRKEKGAKKIEIFSRNSNNIEKLHKGFFSKFPIEFLKKIRADVSLLAFLKAHYNIDIINKVFNYFEGFKTNINERGEINNIINQINSLELYLKDEQLKQKMEDFICKFDIGLNNFIIKKEVKDQKFRISVKGVHTTKEKNNMLDFTYESRGTQSLFFTLANILSGLKDSNVIIIDEIESGFHPEALNKIINYFIDENEDKKAQIIFSSHSLGFMNKLDMHQMYLVEKNNDSESHVYRLNQVHGIRSDDNFLSKYMTGAYGAFPKIRV
jgi:uncharacterized protein